MRTPDLIERLRNAAEKVERRDVKNAASDFDATLSVEFYAEVMALAIAPLLREAADKLENLDNLLMERGEAD